MGLPRPWDQQWALRMQQVMAFETDLLEYGDILDGSPVIAAKVSELIEGARREIENVEAQGGIIAAIESGLHQARTGRQPHEPPARHRIGRSEDHRRQLLPGNGRVAADDGQRWRIMKTDPAAEREQIERLQEHRQKPQR
jgi:(2R)-ethylmalonyl-CoA mutase